jgi:exopolysaccharide biosynthesis polyprenyl glycosylphosphotransferase
MEQDQRTRAAATPPSAPADHRAEAEAPLLSRLNRRGFRLVMLADAIVLAAIMVGAMLVRFGAPPWPSYPTQFYAASFSVSLLIFLASLYFGGLYEREPRLGAPPMLPRAMRQTLGAGGLVALLSLSLTGAARELGLTTARALPFPTLNLVYLIVLGAVGVAANRRLAAWLRTRREGPPRVLLVGPEGQLEIARSHLTVDERRARVVAEATAPADVLAMAADAHATDVVVLDPTWVDVLYPRITEVLERERLTVLLRVSARETMFGLERVREIGGLPFVILRSQTMPRSRQRFKRLTDLVVLAVSAPALLLLLGAVTVYQLVVVGRPLLFWQTRVGQDGAPFRMVKFRTMRVDAEADGQARLADKQDDRVIDACRWIRATRLDELPQLWNVLRGEMSLVGPRPERPELTRDFEADIPGYARRHEIPPGLTGLAQISGRYHTDAEYKLGYDLQYLVNWSPVLDLQILVRTLYVVLARRL